MVDELNQIWHENIDQYVCFLTMNGERKSCIGMKCSAWRWLEGEKRKIYWAENVLTPKPEKHWIEIKREKTATGLDSGEFDTGPTHGYCGAIGQSETIRKLIEIVV